ncbi:hypothetical protein BpHYR1_020768, partial [Brachionus plicatilis]
MSATTLSFDTNYPPPGSQPINSSNDPILINPSVLLQLMNQLNQKQNQNYSQIVLNQPANPAFQPKQSQISIPNNTPILQSPHLPQEDSKKSFISKFVSNSFFPNEQKGFLKLQREIKRCKPNANILNAYVNKKNELVIRTPSLEDKIY